MVVGGSGVVVGGSGVVGGGGRWRGLLISVVLRLLLLRTRLSCDFGVIRGGIRGGTDARNQKQKNACIFLVRIKF